MTVDIELSGKSHPIRFDFLALRRFKEATGMDLIKGNADIGSDELIKLTFFGLQSGYKDRSATFEATEDDVAGWISAKDISKILLALKNSMGVEGEAKAESTGE